jgi:hypothetical protein
MARTRVLLAAVSLAWLLAVSSYGISARAQNSGWTPPHDFGPYWFPDVAADPEGGVHVVWSNSESGFDMVMYSVSADGATWSQPVDVQAYVPRLGTSEATRPTLVVGQNGKIHLSSRMVQVFTTQSTLEGAGNALDWGEPTSHGEGYFSRMVVDKRGVLHLLYTQNVADSTCQICYHLYATQSSDQGVTWSNPVDISIRSTGSAKPQLAVDGENGLHAVWEQGAGGTLGRVDDPPSVMYSASFDGGESWSQPSQLNPAGEPSSDQPEGTMARNITIAAPDGEKLIVAWWSIPDDRVYYQTSTDAGRNWTDPRAIPGIYGIWGRVQSRLDAYSMAVDSAGDVHLVLVGRRGPEDSALGLYHLVWNGQGWSEPELIIRYESDVPEWPRIAVGMGNQLHVVWFVRGADDAFDSESGDYRVYYSQGVSGSPALEAADDVVETSAPVLLPLSAGSVETDTSSTSEQLTEEQLREPSRSISVAGLMSENDDVLLLALSLLPAAFVLTLAMVWQRRRKMRL